MGCTIGRRKNRGHLSRRSPLQTHSGSRSPSAEVEKERRGVCSAFRISLSGAKRKQCGNTQSDRSERVPRRAHEKRECRVLQRHRLVPKGVAYLSRYSRWFAGCVILPNSVVCLLAWPLRPSARIVQCHTPHQSHRGVQVGAIGHIELLPCHLVDRRWRAGACCGEELGHALSSLSLSLSLCLSFHLICRFSLYMRPVAL